MENKEIKGIIEGLLYVWAEPLHIDEICKVLDMDKRSVRKILDQMQEEFNEKRRGLMINQYDDYFQFSTRPDHRDYIAKLVPKTKERPISSSSMEVLAIIAYKQPVTRVEIDNIRGVKSYSPIETLMGKDLIEEVGRLDQIGRPILYGTTTEFLRMFDLKSLDDLPDVKDLDKLDEFMIEDKDEDQ